MDVPYKDRAVKCTEVDSTKVEYALNSDKLHPSVVSAQLTLVLEPEPNEESEGIEEDLHIEPYATADVLPVSSKTIQPTGAGAARNEPSKMHMGSAKGPATADSLPVISGAGAPRNEPSKMHMASAKNAVKTVLLLLLLLILPSGVSSSDLQIHGQLELIEGTELRLFCAGCRMHWCEWYYGGYGDENLLKNGVFYNETGSLLLRKNVSNEHAGFYFCKENIDKAIDIERVTVVVLPSRVTVEVLPNLTSPPEEKSNAMCEFGQILTILLCVMFVSLFND